MFMTLAQRKKNLTHLTSRPKNDYPTNALSGVSVNWFFGTEVCQKMLIISVSLCCRGFQEVAGFKNRVWHSYVHGNCLLPTVKH
jgi:hypothetical protein